MSGECISSLSAGEIADKMQSANIIGQKAIVHELLAANREALAAQLYIESSFVLQTEFLREIIQKKIHFKKFSTAMMINYKTHLLLEEISKGSSGLTQFELRLEKIYAFALNNRL